MNNQNNFPTSGFQFGNQNMKTTTNSKPFSSTTTGFQFTTTQPFSSTTGTQPFSSTTGTQPFSSTTTSTSKPTFQFGITQNKVPAQPIPVRKETQTFESPPKKKQVTFTDNSLPPSGKWLQFGAGLQCGVYSHISEYQFQKYSFNSKQLMTVDRTPIKEFFTTSGYLKQKNIHEWEFEEVDITDMGILNQNQGILSFKNNKWEINGRWWRKDGSDQGIFKSVYYPY